MSGMQVFMLKPVYCMYFEKYVLFDSRGPVSLNCLIIVASSAADIIFTDHFSVGKQHILS